MYPNYYQPQQYAIPDMLNQYKQRTSDIIWVLNENEAMAYPVAPNNTVVLWDKNNPTIYVK